MSFLIGKILFCLLLAFLLGLTIGWLLRSIGARKEAARLQGEIDVSRGELLQQQRRTDSLQAELNTTNTQNEEELRTLNSRIMDLEPFERRTAELEPLQGRVAELEPVAAMAAQLESDNNSLADVNNGLRQQLSDAEGRLADMHRLQQDVTQQQNTINKLYQDNSTISDRALRDTSKLQFRLNALAPVQTELEQQKSALSRSHTDHQQAISDLEQSLASKHQQQLTAKEQEINSQFAQQIASKEQELEAQLQQQLAARQQEMESLHQQQLTAREQELSSQFTASGLRENEAKEAQFSEIKHNLMLAESKVIKAHEEIERLNTEASNSKEAQNSAQSSSLERDIREQETTIERLQSQVVQHNRLQASHDELSGKLDKLQSDLQSCADDKKTLASQVANLTAKAESVPASAATDNAISAQNPATQEAAGRPASATGTGEIAPLFSAPAEKDDLKKIYGIGPVLEGTLNSLGVTSFKQIARFTKDDVTRVTAAIDTFPDRIERDDWIGGAKEEYLKKYGRSVD